MMRRQGLHVRGALAKLHNRKVDDALPADVHNALREIVTYIEILEREIEDLKGEVRRPAWWPGGPR